MVGIFLIVLDGLWVVDTYDSYDTYPREAVLFLILGVCLTIIAYIIIQRKRKYDAQIKNKIMKDPAKGMNNQQFVNRMWKQRETVGNKWVGSLLVILVLIAIFDLGIAARLLQPIMLLGMIGFSFIYIMKDEDEDEGVHDEDFQPKSHKLAKFLRLIDYREHPFSVGLILFILIVLTFLLSKPLGVVMNLETSGNPKYVMSLPSAAFILSGLIFACGFIYIKEHCDFLGIRQAEQSRYKLFQIHFFEIIMCGASLLIWIVILFLDFS